MVFIGRVRVLSRAIVIIKATFKVRRSLPSPMAVVPSNYGLVNWGVGKTLTVEIGMAIIYRVKTSVRCSAAIIVLNANSVGPFITVLYGHVSTFGTDGPSVPEAHRPEITVLLPYVTSVSTHSLSHDISITDPMDDDGAIGQAISLVVPVL